MRNEGLGEQPVMPGLVELGSHARAPQALASFIKTFQSLPRAPSSAVAVRGLKGEDTETKRGLYENRGRREAGSGSVHKVPAV